MCLYALVNCLRINHSRELHIFSDVIACTFIQSIRQLWYDGFMQTKKFRRQ